MNCEECRTLIEEYVADEPGADATSAHLDACAACRELYEDERRERAIYARYLLAVQPRADVWNALETQIKSEFPASRVLRFRQRITQIHGELRTSHALPIAAAIMLMMGGAILSTLDVRRDITTNESMTEQVASGTTELPRECLQEVANANPGRNAVAPRSNIKLPPRSRNVFTNVEDERRRERATARRATMRTTDRDAPAPKASGVETARKIVGEAERRHLEAIALLTRDIAARRTEPIAESIAQYADTLKTIDQVIDDTRRAARVAPNDPVAVQHLLAAYNRKIDVLEELASRED